MFDAPKTGLTFQEKAAQCRRLAGGITDAVVSRRLLEMATEFDERAVAEEAGGSHPR
jgi:hypothetical protein